MTGKEGEKPNIVLITADQLTPFLTGAYGHPVVKTPNLDRLAREGVRFEAAYTSCPLCAPARASLMTGKYPSRIGCHDNANPLACDEPTFAHYLTLQGYDTVVSGKMHLVGPDQLHGLRRRLTTDIYCSDFQWTPQQLDEQGRKKIFRANVFLPRYKTPGIGIKRWSEGFKYDEETQFRALEYIYEQGNKENSSPFFLQVSYHHPHDPFHVTKDLWDLYEGEPIDVPEYPKNMEKTYSAMDRWLNVWHNVDNDEIRNPESLRVLRRSYYALVTYIDQKVGGLLGALKCNNLDDKTVVIFTSDHGDMLGEKGMVQKRCFYEWSVRIPLIMRFPNGWQKGLRVKQPVSFMDLMPTFLDLAGVRSEDRLPVDGKSLMGLIDGSDIGAREVFSEHHAEGILEPCFMIRSGRYKYIYIHKHGAQLFDLQQDPGEWNNLAGNTSLKSVEDKLKAQILELFDPEAIERDVTESYRRRLLIQKALIKNDTHWDYSPCFDATRQYIRRWNSAWGV